MAGSAQRARRLVSGGWILLLTPIVWLAAASLLLAVQPVRILSPLTWLLTALWVGNLAWGVLSAGRRRPRAVDHPDEHEAGVVVTPEEQPDLWRMVRDAARHAGVQPPDELRLTAVGHVVAWPRRRTRLDLGVPVLFVLDPAAVGALVARALAVAESGWTDAAEPVDRFRWLLQGVSGRQLPSGVARQLLRRLDRQRAEGILEADDVATRVAGGPTVGRALAWAHVVHAATLWWFDEYVVPELLQKGQPRPLLPGLESLLGEPGRQRQLYHAVSSGLPNGDGSVPGVADRVYQLQTGALVPDLLPGKPAAELVRAPSTVLEQVAEASLGHTERPRTWADALDAWAVRTSQSCATILGERAPDLDAVLRGVAEKRLAGWVRDVVRSPEADTDELGCFLLTGLLAKALADAGAGRVTAAWSGRIDVVDADGGSLDPARVARMVVEDPDLVPELRTLLVELAVPLDRRLTGGEVRTDPAMRSFHRASGPRRLPGTGFPGLEGPS
ncbi:hypothetical protein [Nocardioides sp. GXQ0305]|uniref:hypothetical protein n=1 Tax=Nocardioides sp. GXQ0305 TaxID=3423912 RepID=UPI003D7D584E